MLANIGRVLDSELIVFDSALSVIARLLEDGARGVTTSGVVFS